MSTHNICFYGDISKIFQELSPNIPPLQIVCSRIGCFLFVCLFFIIIIICFLSSSLNVDHDNMKVIIIKGFITFSYNTGKRTAFCMYQEKIELVH